MSGSTSGIQAALPAQTQSNPLQMLTSIQGLKNQQQQLQNLQQEQQNLQLTNQTGQFNLANAAMDRQAAAAMGLLSMSDADLTGQKGVDAIKQEAAIELGNHSNTPQAQQGYQSFVGAIPPPVQADGTPTPASVYRQFIYQHGQMQLTARDRISVLTPTQGYQNTPAGPVPTTMPSPAQLITNPNGPGSQPTYNIGNGPQTGQIPPGIAPNETTTITQQDPNHPGYYVPVAVPTSKLPGFGNNPPAAPGAPAAPGGGTGTGTQTVGGFPVTGPPQGYTQALQDSQTAGSALTAQASSVAQNSANYKNLLSELNNIQTGPGADRQLRAAEFLQRWSGSPLIAGLTPEQVASGEAFTKISHQIANDSATQLSGSNQSQNNATLATPNLSLSTPGNEQIIHKIEGNIDAIGAKQSAWNSWQTKFGPASFPQFQQWWNQNVDIRHFQADHMGNEERQDVVKGMSQSDQADFVRRMAIHKAAQGQGGWGAAFSAPGSQMPTMPPWTGQ